MSSMSFEEMQSILQGILLSQQFQIEMVETKAASDRAIAIAESNGRAIQAMLDNAASDRLEAQERAKQHQESMLRLENLSIRLDQLLDRRRLPLHSSAP